MLALLPIEVAAWTGAASRIPWSAEDSMERLGKDGAMSAQAQWHVLLETLLSFSGDTLHAGHGPA